MIAGVILGPVLVELRELDAAEHVFEQVIALSEATQDRLHLGAAFANRAWLWSARGQVERTQADLRRVIQLAREIGQSSLERIGTYNLAEDLLWRGEYVEALVLAERCLAIQRAHGEGTTRPDRLLVARVLAARGADDELEGALSTFAGELLGEDEAAVLAVLRAVAEEATGTVWQQAIDGIATLPTTLRLELLHLAVLCGELSTGQIATAVELARGDPFWYPRMGEFRLP